MIHPRLFRRQRLNLTPVALLLMALGLIVLPWTSACAQSASSQTTTALRAQGDQAQPDAQTHMVQLARQGRFDDILKELQANPATAHNPNLLELQGNLETYQKHEALHAEKRLKNYKAARAEMTNQFKQGHLERALIKAIDARSQQSKTNPFLQDPEVVALVARSKAEATQAQDEGDWLTALSLWRDLDLLYLEDSTFHDPLKNAELHTRLLRLYAPDELQRLHIQRETKRGNPTPEPLALGTETWHERLGKVRLGMLYDTVREAKNRHIDSPSYAKLMRGAAARLDVFIKTKGLQTAFASLKDANQANVFETYLHGLNKELDQQGNNFSYHQFFQVVNNILTINQSSLNLPKQILIYEMTQGAMSELDPFSAVIWPEELAQFSRNTEGKFSGVGIQISRPGRITVSKVDPQSAAAKAGLQANDLIISINKKDTTPLGVTAVIGMFTTAPKGKDVTLQVNRPGHAGTLHFTLQSEDSANMLGLHITRPGTLTVVSPLPGTPAHRAGIKPSDEILSVNGQDTTGWSLDQAVHNITGPEGSHVILGIKRQGVAKALSFDLTRSSIEIDSIRGWNLHSNGKWDYYIDPKRQIGYIRLSQFIPQSCDDMDAAFEDMNKHGHVQAVILDLRYDPGGLLRIAANIVDRFVRSGRIVSTVNAQDRMTSQYTARPHNTLRQIPMVVLINQGSASASEIVSGALQDYGAALIVGTRSYGKGSVQDLTPIDGGHALLKLTTQHYKLPSGRIIHRYPKSVTWGIEPDLHIKMTEQESYEEIEMRRDLDILHDPADAANPGKPLPQASEILTKGVDPQLEAGLMYLRVRLVSDTQLASKGDGKNMMIPPTTP